MPRASIAAASLVLVLGLAPRVFAQAPEFASCDDPPAAVLALGARSEIDAYGIVPGASVVVAALNGDGNAAGSVLRFAKAGRAPQDVRLAGTILGLAVAPDGARAFAIVRVTTRKGEVRSVQLACVDLETARVTNGPTIPVTARGLAIGEGGSTLLIASRDEIRTFQLPGLSSGPLYRALGDNVGVAPIPGSSFVLLAQPSRVALADLGGSQGRDGLALSHEVAAPAPLRGMLTSAGEGRPVALSEGERAWCVSASAPVRQAPPLPTELPPTPPRSDGAPAAAAAASAPDPAPTAAAEPAPEPASEPESARQGAPAPEAESPPVSARAPIDPAEPGTVTGRVDGPAMAELGAIVFLGPDNVLREATRVAPDARGYFAASALLPGAYRVVAAGKGGRVLICEPPFITIRVDSKGAVELPVLKVLRAQ